MKTIVMSHKLERDELFKGSFIPREGLEEAVRSMAEGLVKVVIGARRAGKSVFALQMLRATSGSDFAYVNFDDERLMPPLNLDELLKAMAQVYGVPGLSFLTRFRTWPGGNCSSTGCSAEAVT